MDADSHPMWWKPAIVVVCLFLACVYLMWFRSDSQDKAYQRAEFIRLNSREEARDYPYVIMDSSWSDDELVDEEEETSAAEEWNGLDIGVTDE